MKQAYIEIPGFIVVILIAFMLLGENFNKSTVVNFVDLKATEIVSCTEVKKCISENKVLKERKNKPDPIKDIKDFLRQKIY